MPDWKIVDNGGGGFAIYRETPTGREWIKGPRGRNRVWKSRAKAQAYLDTPPKPEPPDYTGSPMYKAAEQVIAARQYTPGTEPSIRKTRLACWVTECFGPITPDEFFRVEKVNEYMAWLRKRPTKTGGTRAESYIKVDKGHLCTMWGICHALGLCSQPVPVGRNPLVAKPAARITPPSAWTAQEVEMILEACSVAPGGWSAERWRSLVLAFYDTGARATNLVSCRWPDWDVRNGVLNVPAATDKEGKGRRRKVSERTAEALQWCWIRREYDGDLIWPMPVELRSMRDHFRKILDAAGLPSTYRDLFQKIRRTHGTHVYLASGSIAIASESLNHSCMSLTKRHYIDPTQAPDTFHASGLPLHQKGTK